MELASWWLLSAAVWLAAISALTPVEVVVAMAVAVPTALVARLARRQVAPGWRVRARWFAPARRLPAAVPVETGQVWRAAIRSARGDQRGRGRTRVVDAGQSPQRRAVAQALLSTSPGLVVVDTGEESRVHAFGSQPDSLEREVGS
jgi:hypothetical protein